MSRQKKSILKEKKAIAPIIAVVLLVVIAVILVTIILSFGKGFAIKSLDKAGDIKDFSKSDAGNFIYPKTFSDGVLQINYNPVGAIGPVVITHYTILGSDLSPVELTTPITLTAGQNIINLESLYGFNSISPEVDIQLITSDNTYIDIGGQIDNDLVCTPGGTGTLVDPIIICDASDLNNIRNDLDANYVLGKDIDLYSFSRIDVNGWLPINSFTGSFNGNDYVVSNLYINRPGTDYVGLFGSINGYLSYDDEICNCSITTGATIQNLGLENVDVIGGEFVGGFAGSVAYLIIDNIYVTGEVSGVNNVGGFSGYISFSQISNSYSTSNISGIGGGFAGIIYGKSTAMNNDDSNITNCYATGNVDSGGGFANFLLGGTITDSYATGSVASGDYVGGFIGNIMELSGETGYTVIITNCYATGNVIGGEGVGGFAGFIDGTISNCYATGNATATGDYVGGFTGVFVHMDNGAEDTLSNVYSVGAISGSGDNVGGLIGYSGGGVSNSFYDTTISGQSDNDGRGVPKITALMKNEDTFTGWTFPGTWSITEGTTYPYLTSNVQSPLPQ
ncbi:MAG: GLUG motif-containing protein [archaeon]|jgi:hypothetical protein